MAGQEGYSRERERGEGGREIERASERERERERGVCVWGGGRGFSSGSQQRVLPAFTATLAVRQVMDIVSSFHQLWSLPFQVAITLYLLYRQVHWAFVGGLILLVFFLSINLVLSKRIGALTGEMMKKKVRVVDMRASLSWDPCCVPWHVSLHVSCCSTTVNGRRRVLVRCRTSACECRRRRCRVFAW